MPDWIRDLRKNLRFAAILTGAALLLGVYTGWTQPLGLYAMLIPVLLAALAWGWVGSTVSAICLTLAIIPSNPSLIEVLGALLLSLLTGSIIGYLVDERHLRRRLLAETSSFEDRLTVVLNMRAVWEVTLRESMRVLQADDGAWIWDSPEPEIMRARDISGGVDSVLRDKDWRDLTEAKHVKAGWLYPVRELQALGLRDAIRLPVQVAGYNGHLLLLREDAFFASVEREHAVSMVRLARQVAMGQVRYARADLVLERQLQEMKTLQHLNQLVSESLDLDETLHAVLEALAELITYDVAEITYWDPDEEILIRGALLGSEKAESYIRRLSGSYSLDEGLSGWLARHREPLLVDDMRTFEKVRPKLDDDGVMLRSYLGVPLTTRDELVGTLEVGAMETGAYSPHDLDLLQSLGAQAAITIEKARLYQTSQQRVRILERLSDVARAAGRAGDLPTLFTEIVTHIAEILDAEIAGILLYDTEHRQLTARAPFLGIPAEWLENYVIDLTDEQAEATQVFEQSYWMLEDAQSNSQVEQLGLLPLALAAGIRTTLWVPLEAGGERVGFIQVANPRTAPRFTENDVARLMMLTSQLSGMVRISQLLEHMERRADQMSSLASVASAIGSSLDLDRVLESMAQAVSQVLDCRRTAIFVLDRARRVLQLAAAQGVSDEYIRNSQAVPIELGGRAHAVATKAPVVVDDVQDAGELGAVAPLAGSEGFRAYADIPLLRGEQVVGLLSVQFAETHHFDADELDLLNILAEQAAVAVENARLYEETDEELRRRVASLEALQRVTQEITSTLNLDRILELVLNEAMRFAEAEAGLIVLWQMDASPDVRSFMGYDEVQLTQLRQIAEDPASSSIFERFLQNPEITYIPDLEEVSANQGVLEEARSLLLSPVFYQEQLAAIILLQSEQPHAFTEAGTEFVGGLAAQTSIAIGNARRYEEQMKRGEVMHRRAEQMRLFLEVSRTLRSDRPLDKVLLDMAYATQEAINYDIVMISVREGDVARRVAGAGMPLKELERLKEVPQPWNKIARLFREKFRLGQSYYVPTEQQDVWRGDIDVVYEEEVEVERSRPGMWHPHDLLLVPLYDTRQEILGYMSVDKPRDGRVPTRASVEVLELFAAQIALAIENSRLVESLRLQINTLSLFNELSRSITAKLDLPIVLNTVVQAVTNLLGYDYSTVLLQDPATERFVPRSSSGYALDLLGELSFGPGEGMVAKLAATGMPMVLEDTETDLHFMPDPLDVGSSIMAPLRAGGRTVGVVSADRRESGEFSPTEVATFTAVADQVSVAVENARLFDEVKRFSEELEQRVEERTEELAEALGDLRSEQDRTSILYRIASELVASLDIDRVLSKALSFIRDAVEAQKGTILLLDAETGYLYRRASIGTGEEVPPGGIRASLDRDKGLIGWILQNAEAITISDVQTDERWLVREEGPVEDELTRSVLGVPIVSSEGQPVGAIFLHAYQVGAFTENDLRLVEAAAVQLGNAMNNAQLYRMLRKQAERLGSMLRTQQVEAAKSQAILEGIADGVMVADANGRIILFNAAAGRILSVSRSQALGRRLDEMLGLYGTMAREWLSQVREWQEHPESYETGEFLAERLQFERRMVSVHLSPVISEGHEFLGTVSVFRDVTAEVEAERAKTDFVSTVSHELRTPMTAVKGYVDLLLMGATGDLSDQQQQFLDVIKLNTDRLTSLVNDLLDISRIETGKIELAPESLDMVSVIEQVVLTIRPKAEEKGLRMHAVVPQDLPRVFGDPDRVVQILTNLVGNAYKYTPTGGIVSVHAYVRDEMVHVAVADTGIGVSIEDRDKIFDRFFRVDDPMVHAESGTGLGLSITTSLVQMHGGEIMVESEPGEGSIFTFTLPILEGEDTSPLSKPPEGFAPHFRTTILVVEDDVEVANLLRFTLESEGHRVVIANSGEEALRTARKHRPDLISLDILLPDFSGFEVLELLRHDSRTAGIPVVIVSVMSDKDRGRELGAIDYLTKPLDMDRLLSVVNDVVVEQGTILIADDDEDTLLMLCEALRDNGLGLRTVRRGDRALQMTQMIQPALVLLDLKMPGMDGYQVLRAMRENPDTEDIPVIVMTGTMQPNEAVPTEIEEATGVVRFLTKPFSIDDLASEISSLVSGEERVR
jgi:PAS domain S-box-containing protein